MATYTWALIHNGREIAAGTELYSQYETAEEYGRARAATPLPEPADEVHVWAGVERVGDSVRVRRHPRKRALAVAS